MAGSEEPRARLGRIVRSVCRILGVPIAAVALVEGERFRIVASEGCPFDEVPRHGSLPGCTLDAGRLGVIADLARADPPIPAPEIDGRPVRFYAGVPIRGPEGDLVGVLCSADFAPRTLDEPAIAQLEDLAAVAADQLLLAREFAEHRRLLDVVRDREQRFRDFAEVASDWFWETDAELRFTWLSDTVSVRLGVRPEWHYGKTRLELAATEEARVAVRAIHEIMLRREPFFDAEYQYLCPAGVRWLRISGRPIFDQHGRFVGYRGTGRDITDLKCQEQRIREVEERYRRLVELAPDGVLVKDGEHRIHLANRAAASIFGFEDPAALIGRRTVDFYTPEGRALVETDTRALLGGGDALPRAELRLLRRDGEERAVETLAARIDDRGEPRALVVLRDVTERKRAELALRDSEQRFRDFAEVAADWFWEMDAELRFTWLSDAVRRVFGLAPEWHYGKTRLEIAADEEALAVARRVQELMLRREPFADVEYLRRGPTGDHWLRISGKPVFDAAGRFVGYRGTGRDVTQLRKEEAARREAEERYRVLVELSPDPVVLVEDGRIVFTNQPAARILGVDEPGKLVGRSVYEFVAPEHRALVRARQASLLRPGDTLPPVELSLLRTDGARAEIEAKGSLVLHQGRRMLLGVYRDIGARKAAERALREAEERYRRLFESAPVGIIVYRDGRYVHANRAAAAILGAASPDELVGCDPFELILEPHREIVRARAARLQAGGQSEPPIEIEMRRLDGPIVSIASRGVSILDQGRPAIQVIIEDVTERKRLEGELREAEERWRRLFEHAPIGLLVHRDGRYLVANEAAARILGADGPAALVGREPCEIVLQPWQALVRERAQRLLGEGGVAPPVELELRRLDGEIVTVEAVGTGITLGGRPAAQIAIRDVTERKRAEQALRKAEARWRTLLELSPEAVLLIRDGVYVFANRRAATLLGAGDPRAVVGLRPRDVIDEEFWPIVEERGRRLLEQGGYVPPIEIRIRRLDGTLLEVEAAGAAVEDGGRPVIQTVLRDITERKRLEAELRRLAHHDPLTGLPNRTLFFDRLEQALRRSEREGRLGALLLLDLDGFKLVNDTHGHDGGDALLVAVGRRLERVTRRTDTVARLAGDEFAVLLYPVASAAAVERVGERIVRALRRTVEHRGRALPVAASLGVTIFPRDGDRPDPLLKNADLALYRAKRQGSGSVVFLDRAMHAEIEAQRRLAEELRSALAGDGLELSFEPQVELAGERPVGLQARLVWRHPRLGLLDEAGFAAAAEEAGQGIELARRTFALALARMTAWHAAGVAFGRITLAASPTLLADAGWVDGLLADLDAAGLGADRLTLELGETALDGRHAEAAAPTLERLRGAGLRVVLVDLAICRPALAELARRPVDLVKLGRARVQALAGAGEAARIARAVAAVARELGLALVAEGIDDRATLEAARALGCRWGQGRLWAPPLPAETAAAWLAAARAGRVPRARRPSRSARPTRSTATAPPPDP